MYHMSEANAQVCPRCDKRVYFAEQVVALGRHWHKACFLCVLCNKRLDSRTGADHQGQPYCTHCHRANFGPNGYGFGGAANCATTLRQINGNVVAGENQRARPVSEVVGVATAQHLRADSSDTGSGSRGSSPLLSPTADSHRWSSVNPAPRRPAVAGGFVPPKRDLCRRCDKPVYFAEKIVGAGQVWHKATCFTCRTCKKGLQPAALCERDSEVYCKMCYGREWGPKGYGYGLGAGVLQSEAAPENAIFEPHIGDRDTAAVDY